MILLHFRIYTTFAPLPPLFTYIIFSVIRKNTEWILLIFLMIFEDVLWLKIFIYHELSAARLQPSTGSYKIQ